MELVKPDTFRGGGHIDTENIPEVDNCHNMGCKLITNVGDKKVKLRRGSNRKSKEKPVNGGNKVEIYCPTCANHPVFKVKCMNCKGKGKIEVYQRIGDYSVK